MTRVSAGRSAAVRSAAGRSASDHLTANPSVVGHVVHALPPGRRPGGGSYRIGPLVVAVCGYVVAWWPGATVAVVLWGLAPWVAARRLRTRARRRLGAALAEVLELAARGVRTGVAPDRALVDAAELVGPPVGELVSELVRWAGAGNPRDASRRWALGHHDPAVSIVAATVGLVSGRDGGAARGFEAAATVLRDAIGAPATPRRGRPNRGRRRRCWSAAPVVLAVGALAVDPSRVGRVLAEPIALVCVAVGAGCELVGAWWMSRLLVDVSGPRS